MKYGQSSKPWAEFAKGSKLDEDGQRFRLSLEVILMPPIVEGTKVENAEYYPINGEPFLKGNDATDVHPNDVTQGQLGDCYLLASLAAVADKNPDGTYTVTFNKRNSPFAICKPAQEEATGL